MAVQFILMQRAFRAGKQAWDAYQAWQLLPPDRQLAVRSKSDRVLELLTELRTATLKGGASAAQFDAAVTHSESGTEIPRTPDGAGARPVRDIKAILSDLGPATAELTSAVADEWEALGGGGMTGKMTRIVAKTVTRVAALPAGRGGGAAAQQLPPTEAPRFVKPTPPGATKPVSPAEAGDPFGPTSLN